MAGTKWCWNTIGKVEVLNNYAKIQYGNVLKLKVMTVMTKTRKSASVINV